MARPPLPPLGTEEGTASFLTGINDNENYKAGLLHLWCPGGWVTSSVLEPPVEPGQAEVPSWLTLGPVLLHTKQLSGRAGASLLLPLSTLSSPFSRS